MVVQVLVGLHAEELGGDELPVLRIPLRQRQFCGVVGEGALGVLVQADGDADVVLAQPDGVGGLLNGTGRGGAGIEDVGERDTGQPDEAGHRVRVGHLVAAAEAELDVLPLHARVGQRELDGFGTHLHCGLLEPAEWMQAHADDGDVISHRTVLPSPSCVPLKPAGMRT